MIVWVMYSWGKVKEFGGEEYGGYDGMRDERKKEKRNMLKLVVKGGKGFWRVGVVEFLWWGGLMLMWS